jgi:hypothetical protein
MKRFVTAHTAALLLTDAATNSAENSGKLTLLIPGLFGPEKLKVDSMALLPDGSTHSAHFNSAFQAEFTQFNIALASQLAAIPLPTPASGFTYTFDENLGVFQRSTQSFGPILTERAETIGRQVHPELQSSAVHLRHHQGLDSESCRLLARQSPRGGTTWSRPSAPWMPGWGNPASSSLRTGEV